MKYNNKVRTARKKYLELKLLSSEEQSVIERDFNGKDYQYYQLRNGKDLLLPEKYSPEQTYINIEERISGYSSVSSKNIIRYVASISAILVFAVISFYIYQSINTPSLISISTSYGEQKEIGLPDGSTIILNSLSSITYPQDLKGNMRRISLEGEAYFDIVKNPDKPFVVNVPGLEVKVLGTKFNITAYENEENIITSLFEGSISVSTSDGDIQVLTPNEKSIYNKNRKNLEILHSPDIDNEIYWMIGKLFFDNEPLTEILKTLERERKILFELKDSDIGKLRITANFDRDESIEDILNILAQSGEFTYTIIDGNVFIINK